MLPAARHRSNISTKVAEWPEHNEAEMGPANLLHVLVENGECKERLDLKIIYYQIDMIRFSPNGYVHNFAVVF